MKSSSPVSPPRVPPAAAASHARVVRPDRVAAPPRPSTRGAGPRHTYDRVTLGGGFGGLSGAAHLDQASTADWRLGWIGSVDATPWLHQYGGICASGIWAQDSLPGATLPGRGKLNKFTYAADPVPPHPTAAAS